MSLLPSRRLSARRAIWTAAAGVLVLTGAFLACVTPPVGWEGAGRLQTLPMQQPDSAPPGIDGADDTGGGDFDTGATDTGSPDTEPDTADDTGTDSSGSVDAGMDTGGSTVDAGSDAGHDGP